MEDKVFFVIGPPRSGSTLLARMIGAHSLIYGRPEPHLLTPLAHLGYYAKVDKAPYDAVLAAEATRDFVRDLPRGEQDYIDACRAYCDTLYDRMLATKPEKRLFLDKSTTSRVVATLVKKGYVEQQPDASDGRASVLSATRRGRALCGRINADLVAQQRALLEDFDPAVRAGVIDVIRRLARAADARFRTGVSVGAGCASAECSSQNE